MHGRHESQGKLAVARNLPPKKRIEVPLEDLVASSQKREEKVMNLRPSSYPTAVDEGFREDKKKKKKVKQCRN